MLKKATGVTTWLEREKRQKNKEKKEEIGKKREKRLEKEVELSLRKERPEKDKPQ